MILSSGRKKIEYKDLVPMDLFVSVAPLKIDLVYSHSDNFMAEAIYRPDARLWLQKDLAAVVILASYLARARARHGWGLILYDGLRTATAQEVMADTAMVQANPHWLAEETRMLTKPGKGAHPRGLAVDLSLVDDKGAPVPMGTAFDALPEGGNTPDVNPAHREYQSLSETIKKNRQVLHGAMMDAAEMLGLPLWPLPTEWWDFRAPNEVYQAWAPLSDDDLPPQMRMTGRNKAPHPDDLPEAHFETLKENLIAEIAPFKP